nr:pilus assembly protein TadG [Sphingomonas sp. Y38-1Y]
MGGGTWAQSSYMPRSMAERFFDANIRTDAYGSNTITRSFSESAGKVTGNASAILPMTLMRVLGKTTEKLEVTCETEMRLPNTDVMFVLDTTGSMGETLSGDSRPKIDGLRVAVKCFYEIVAKLDTDAACDGDAPSGGVGSAVQVRFGFVPYATNANVGRLLQPAWMADEWTYQSREISAIWGVWNSFYDNTLRGPASSWSAWKNRGAGYFQSNGTSCSNPPADDYEQADGGAINGQLENDAWFVADVPFTQRDYQGVYNSSGKVCQLQERERTVYRRSYLTRAVQGSKNAIPTPAWRYKPVRIDVGPLKSGTSWNDSIDLPIGNGYVNSTIRWDGCIEERATVRQSNYQPIPAAAHDLQINEVPSSGDADTLWAPAIGGATYVRRSTYSNSSAYNQAEITTFTNFTGRAYSCPTPARRLQDWDPGNFGSYVDSLTPGGNTYHDIGLLWGARLLSPTGLFRTDNEFTPQGGEIERHLIFMTDGDTCTDADNYQAYGIAWFDRRQTDPGAAPTEGCGTSGTLTQQVNARTAALCEATKNLNITLWVIWFGDKNTSIEGRMRSCASEGRFFSARNSTQLQQTFRSIADQISALRLTQ